MRTIKGPALLIAQLASDRPPFNSLPGIAKWAASLGYKGLQLPSWDTRFLDLHRADPLAQGCAGSAGAVPADGDGLRERPRLR